MLWRKAMVILGILLWPAASLATFMDSAHYYIDENFVGPGGLGSETSTHYQAAETIGEPAIGDSSSTNYQSGGGFTLPFDPALTFSITSGAVNFSPNPITSAQVSTATSTFNVIDYTSYGYNIVIIGSSPTNPSGGHALTALTTPTASSPGTEQFGINTVANTGFGANASGGFGTAATNYNTANLFKYVSGDVIATSAKTSPETDFTISYIANINRITTPGGDYAGTFTLICTATY